MGVNILMTLPHLPPPPPPRPPLSPVSRANPNEKRKNHSGVSIFWDVINSWLDIQIDFEKKMVLGRKSTALNKILTAVQITRL